ncbi:MAG: chemotaxis response regulator protein-glutamate methylesterase [Halieaceae bacterium]|jgi:two-component system chemotaxis response regulator CheB|nr:chemotaxis response regulator protein-glutamate methylesterase [Halieaceae bacterium]
MTIKVMIVDDSAVVRQVLTQQLDGIQGIKVIASATDPIFAMKKMAEQWPDVIILDIEMPRMDGITFLKKIMAEHPTPVVICSTLTERGAAVTMEAMASGAVDIITKPKAGLKAFLSEHKAQLIDAIKAAAMARVRGARAPAAPAAARLQTPSPKLSADAVLASSTKPMSETTDRVVAIGTSTGGTQALERVLVQLPRDAPGIVVVQHMPEQFTAAFAKRLDSVCQITVKEAEMGDRVMPGLALIANGGKHLILRRSGAQYRVELKDGPLISRHRPSVDVLFRSVANSAGPNAVGIIMTGMGDDGASGMREMHDAGAYTIAQNEATCVVYGMPKEAVKAGGVDIEVPIDDIPRLLLKHGRG